MDSDEHAYRRVDTLDYSFQFSGAAITRCGEEALHQLFCNDSKLKVYRDEIDHYPISQQRYNNVVDLPTVFTKTIQQHTQHPDEKLLLLRQGVSASQVMNELPMIGGLLGQVQRPTEPWKKRRAERASGVVIQLSGQYGGGMGHTPVGSLLRLDLGGPALEWMEPTLETLEEELTDRLSSLAKSLTEYAAVVVVEAVESKTLMPRTRDWAQSVRAICTKAKVPLVLDECLSGMGGLGLGMFAFETLGIEADLIVIGKRFGLSALLARGRTARLCERPLPRPFHSQNRSILDNLTLSSAIWSLPAIILRAIGIVTIAVKTWKVLDKRDITGLFKDLDLPPPHSGAGFVWMWRKVDIRALKDAGLTLDERGRCHIPMDVSQTDFRFWLGQRLKTSALRRAKRRKKARKQKATA